MRLSPLAVVVFLSTKVSGFSPTSPHTGTDGHIHTFPKHQYHYKHSNGPISHQHRLLGRNAGKLHFVLRASSDNGNEESNSTSTTTSNGVSAPPAPSPQPQFQEEQPFKVQPPKKSFFNDAFINDDLEALVEERAQEQIAQKDEEISQLVRQKEQRETTINRLKFQLLDFKEAVENSEKAKVEVERQLDDMIEKENDAKADKSKENDFLEQLKSQFNLEKKEISGNLKAVTKELDEVKLASKKELEKARSDAEEEKVQLMLEIASLQQALQSTTLQIDQTKSEMDAIASNNVKEFGRQQQDLSKKDEEINILLVQKDELQEELNLRMVELDQLKAALSESEEQVALLEKRVDEVQKESEQARRADQDLIEGLKSQFSREKASLSKQLQTFTEDVTKFKADKEDQLKKVKSDSEGEINRLNVQLTSARKKLEKIQGEYDSVRDTAENAQREADEKVRRQKQESKRFERAVKSVTSQEKKAFKREIWDLETKLEAAKYNYYTLKRELKDMEKAASAFEDKMTDLESSYTKQLEDLDAKLKAEELAYQQSQESARERMQRLILAFQRRLVRRQERAKKDIENVRDELTKNFDLQKKEMQQEKEDAVNEVLSKAKMDLEEATRNFDSKIEDFKSQMEAAKKKSQKKMANMEETYEANLKYERIKAVKAKEALIAEKDTAIKAIQTDAATKYNMLKTDLTSQLDKSLEEKTALQNTLTERDLKIAGYEEERESFRKLLRQTLRVTRNKILRRGKK